MECEKNGRASKHEDKHTSNTLMGLKYKSRFNDSPEMFFDCLDKLEHLHRQTPTQSLVLPMYLPTSIVEGYWKTTASSSYPHVSNCCPLVIYFQENSKNGAHSEEIWKDELCYDLDQCYVCFGVNYEYLNSGLHVCSDRYCAIVERFLPGLDFNPRDHNPDIDLSKLPSVHLFGCSPQHRRQWSAHIESLVVADLNKQAKAKISRPFLFGVTSAASSLAQHNSDVQSNADMDTTANTNASANNTVTETNVSSKPLFPQQVSVAAASSMTTAATKNITDTAISGYKTTVVKHDEDSKVPLTHGDVEDHKTDTATITVTNTANLEWNQQWADIKRSLLELDDNLKHAKHVLSKGQHTYWLCVDQTAFHRLWQIQSSILDEPQHGPSFTHIVRTLYVYTFCAAKTVPTTQSTWKKALDNILDTFKMQSQLSLDKRDALVSALDEYHHNAAKQAINENSIFDAEEQELIYWYQLTLKRYFLRCTEKNMGLEVWKSQIMTINKKLLEKYQQKQAQPFCGNISLSLLLFYLIDCFPFMEKTNKTATIVPSDWISKKIKKWD
ncbi:hypothetical protein RFI_08332 [Reticulomyxa filosa]|uniref:Uncharacterized protein n=1 Tax=Reticulomyxa filosa TaxID=46433 RepID=X6NR53_RETFI|nr:hypothetical protein RFI_08332 [Reticulomyxa filosa]|eukprot:ETO28795.1 hypothetical protein RFI_08332 [Reticulomyxa filosa]